VASQQTAEHPGDEQVAVAHHRRAEQLGLQAWQAARRMGCVERVVWGLQETGDHKYCVSASHRHDPNRKPACRRDARDQGAERHAAERREQDARALAKKSAAIRPRQHEQRHNQ
jgi:hypothetical protein